MKIVTAAIMMKDNKIFIAKRSKNSTLANKWEFPGGKVEPGETYQECLKREIKEELDIEIVVGDFFDESILSCKDDTIKLLAYWVNYLSGKIKLSVHDEATWASISELELFDFAPADVPFVKKLKSMHKFESG